MSYEWDEAKNRSNQDEHGIDFGDIERFDWDHAVRFRSDRHGERRFAAIGYIGDRLVFVVYTERDTNLRTISMRDPSDKERERYDRERYDRPE